MAVPVLLLVIVFFLLSLALPWRPSWLPLQTSSARAGTIHSSLHSLLKPRTPDDCPACRLASAASPEGRSAPAPVRPWREVKSRRGAPKRVKTEGYACPNQQCPYFGITDDQIHALLGDGTHSQAERIQTFRCQACRTIFSARRHTPLYRLKTPSQQIAMVLTALAEGLDPSAAERVFCYHRTTITTWLTRAGKHAEVFHERCFRNLYIPHLQLDEIRTRLRSSTQVLWLWLAIDPCTKLLPVLSLGPRTQRVAHSLIHSLRRLLAHDCLPLFPSDGLNLYFYALTAHFGQWLQVDRRGHKVRQRQVAAGLIYGQVKKSYRRRKLVRVTHVIRLGTEAALAAALQGLGLSGRLNTAFIERMNLSVRHGVAALARRTWATAQHSPHPLAHLESWRAYYHFVRPHASLRMALVQRYRQRTPAMAAGRTQRRWTAREVLSCPLPKVSV
jgi:IS1 family transposase